MGENYAYMDADEVMELQDILQCDKPGRRAILIKNDGNAIHGLTEFHHKLRRLFKLVSVIRLTQVIPQLKFLVFRDQEQVLDIHDANDIVRRLLIDRISRILLLSENIHDLLIAGIHIEECHINTRNHNILRDRIPKIEHVVDHLLLVGLDHTLFVADLHDRAELILCDRVLFLVRIHMDHL